MISKYELKMKLPRKVWAILYKASLKKLIDQKVYGEKRKLRKDTKIVFYIIRRRPPGAGLFSNVFHVIQGIINARNIVIEFNRKGEEDQRVKVDKQLENKKKVKFWFQLLILRITI